jgi:hypothetical protein
VLEGIDSRTAVTDVAAPPSVEVVVSGAGLEHVVVIAADQAVVAAEAGEVVPPVPAVELGSTTIRSRSDDPSTRLMFTGKKFAHV